jgi:hypothetical protein
LGDDTTVLDDAVLWRRVHHLFWQQVQGGWRISSGAFDNASDGSGMSVHLADIAVVEDRSLESLLPDPADEFGMVALTANHVRKQSQIIVREPEPDDPTHAEVIGLKPTKVRKRLRDGAAVVRLPPHLT